MNRLQTYYEQFQFPIKAVFIGAFILLRTTKIDPTMIIFLTGIVGIVTVLI